VILFFLRRTFMIIPYRYHLHNVIGVPDLTKIRRLIGFKLTKSITESVQSVIDYYRSLGQNVILE